MLSLHDTAAGAVRPLDLRRPGEVSMYVCGPTVYDRPHLGHGRFALAFDVLRRYLIWSGLQVHYVSNITDIDDKIIDRARREGCTEEEVASRVEEQWYRAMDALEVLRPDEAPHATGWVERMIEVVDQLVRRDVAYQTDGGVYLSVADVPTYGLLAHQGLETLRAGARVAANEDKRSPLDFALWKGAHPGEPSWASPWGHGRPGWHTECVAMSLGLLGDGFDIHGGAMDLVFPHHENERAQALALGREFARHWVHNGFVTVEGDKMSKSLGNFTTLDDLLADHDPRAYRLLVLQSHYRSPIEVTPETVGQAEEGLARLDSLARRFRLADPMAHGPVVSHRRREVSSIADPEVTVAFEAFAAHMDDDLDTPAALAGIFELVREANWLGDQGNEGRSYEVAETAALLCGALGLRLRPGDEELDEETARLARERDAARAERNWEEADRIRDLLRARGWTVEDGAQGTVVRR